MGNHHMGIEGGMNMGRKWFGVMAVVLVFAVLTAGSAVAAEGPQATSDSSKCWSKEQMNRAIEFHEQEKYAEAEAIYRKMASCLKPAVLSGKLRRKRDAAYFIRSHGNLAQLLYRTGREDEADALVEELVSLSNRRLLWGITTSVFRKMPLEWATRGG